MCNFSFVTQHDFSFICWLASNMFCVCYTHLFLPQKNPFFFEVLHCTATLLYSGRHGEGEPWSRRKNVDNLEFKNHSQIVSTHKKTGMFSNAIPNLMTLENIPVFLCSQIQFLQVSGKMRLHSASGERHTEGIPPPGNRRLPMRSLQACRFALYACILCRFHRK